MSFFQSMLCMAVWDNLSFSCASLSLLVILFCSCLVGCSCFPCCFWCWRNSLLSFPPDRISQLLGLWWWWSLSGGIDHTWLLLLSWCWHLHQTGVVLWFISRLSSPCISPEGVPWALCYKYCPYANPSWPDRFSGRMDFCTLLHKSIVHTKALTLLCVVSFGHSEWDSHPHPLSGGSLQLYLHKFPVACENGIFLSEDASQAVNHPHPIAISLGFLLSLVLPPL